MTTPIPAADDDGMSGTAGTEQAIDHVHHWFGRVFLGGVPMLLNDGGAFLSFICVLAGVDALAGYRFPEVEGHGRNRERFMRFVEQYFPEEYRPLSADLWKLRNALLHAFNTGPFALCHHQSQMHLSERTHEGVSRRTLNAEEFYAALVHASAAYFADLRASPPLQARFQERLASKSGGAPTVIPLT